MLEVAITSYACTLVIILVATVISNEIYELKLSLQQKLEVVNERCVTIRLRIEGVWIKFIQVCALTDYKDDVAKDTFFGCICPWGKLLRLSLKNGISAAIYIWLKWLWVPFVSCTTMQLVPDKQITWGFSHLSLAQSWLCPSINCALVSNLPTNFAEFIGAA